MHTFSALFQSLWARRHSGGVLLMGGAVASKLLGLVRDRLFTAHFSAAELDAILGTFRIPDFFFFLLISGVISTIMLPRLSGLTPRDESHFTRSLFWGTGVVFGLLSLLVGVFFPSLLHALLPQLSPDLVPQAVLLGRWLSASVWVMSLSTVLSAYAQHKHQFLGLALAPLCWTLSIIIGTALYAGPLSVIGPSAFVGGICHFAVNGLAALRAGFVPGWSWRQPVAAFTGLTHDATHRILNGSVLQVLQVVDVFIAGLIGVGAITAFSFGSALGHLLLTIVGISFGRAVFPALTRHAHQWPQQWAIIRRGLLATAVFTVPYTLLSLIFAPTFLTWVYGLDGPLLASSTWVFRLTVLSLPFACAIPLLTRWMLANNDAKTPTLLSALAAVSSVGSILLFSFVLLPPSHAIVGLGIGNFVTNTLLSTLLAVTLWRKWKHATPSPSHS